MGHAAIAERVLDGRIHDVVDMHWPHDALVVDGNIHKDFGQIDILLIVGANQVMKGMPRDRQHRLIVHLGVIETVEQMDATRARGRQTDAQPSGILGVAACREGRRFLVSHLDESYLVLVRP